MVQTDYLVLHLQCTAAGVADLHAVYRRPEAWRDSFAVPCERPDQAWTVMWPVYQHLPHHVFAGFELPGDGSLRAQSIGRVANLAGYPLMLRLRLPDDWRERPMHHTLDLAKVSPTRVRPAPGALSPPPPPLPPPSVSWDPAFVRGRQPFSAEAPALPAWTASGGVSVSAAADHVLVHGNATEYGYQIISPPIAVPPRSRMVVRVYGEIEQGRVGFGILDGTGQQWLLPAVWGRSDFVVNTGANNHVTMVFANVRQPADGPDASRFTVSSISYEFQSGRLDWVRSLLWPPQ